MGAAKHRFASFTDDELSELSISFGSALNEGLSGDEPLLVSLASEVTDEVARRTALGKCATCGELQVSSHGILDLNEDGECDACAERRERVAGQNEDHMRDVAAGWDFDHSMNY